ncbi:MAG: type II toxin-antitoxin system PemK/MazF family toxin [Tetragenococcus sp.]|nr:type II toxin-antitoxin system PemK/MazF family toxin [Tetragenococcus sp.]
MIKRGEVYYADLSPIVGSEQGGVRPVLIISNDLGNYFSPTIIVAAVTAKMEKSNLPTHIDIEKTNKGLDKDSVILLEQIRTIDKTRLKEKVCTLEDETMEKANEALKISVGIDVVVNEEGLST